MKKLLESFLFIAFAAIFANTVFASISSKEASDFVKDCRDNPLCTKIEAQGTHAEIDCPEASQSAEIAFVHAGDGQTVYELPHDGFILGISTNSATIDISTHKHSLSWVALVCTDPTPSPDPSPLPSPTPTPSVEPEPTENPNPSPTPIPGIEKPVEEQYNEVLEEIREETGEDPEFPLK